MATSFVAPVLISGITSYIIHLRWITECCRTNEFTPNWDLFLKIGAEFECLVYYYLSVFEDFWRMTGDRRLISPSGDRKKHKILTPGGAVVIRKNITSDAAVYL